MWPFNEVITAEKQRIYNLNECEIISDVLLKLDVNLNKNITISIIIPYKHQVFMLRKLLNLKFLSKLKINIDTVDGFQGKESDVMIFSLTRTVGSFRFHANARRLNVALSRARDKIFEFGKLDYALNNLVLKSILESNKIYVYNTEFSWTNVGRLEYQNRSADL